MVSNGALEAMLFRADVYLLFSWSAFFEEMKIF